MTAETISRIPGSSPLSAKNPAADPAGSSTSLWITLLKRLLICPVTGPKSNENLRIVQFLGDTLCNDNNWIINSVQVRGAYQQPLNIPPGNWFDRDRCHRIACVLAAFHRSPPVCLACSFSGAPAFGMTVLYRDAPVRGRCGAGRKADRRRADPKCRRCSTGDGGFCEPLVELRREAPWEILEEISPVENGQKLEAAVTALWLVFREAAFLPVAGSGRERVFPPRRVQGAGA